MRKPDLIIGPPGAPYLLRWHLLPRNRWFNVYLHRILRSDDDRALHDHPYASMSIVLSGGYTEVVPAEIPYVDDPYTGEREMRYERRWRGAGALVFRGAEQAHRLEVERPAWSLFVTGPRVREWGFHCPRGWVPWQRFADERDMGRVGAGCGEAS